MPIQFIGLKNLTDREITTLNRIYQKALPKIEREVRRAKIKLKIQKYDAEGKRARFSLNAQVNHPSIKFTAKTENWIFATALHKIFNKLETEITKKEPKKRRQKTVRL